VSISPEKLLATEESVVTTENIGIYSFAILSTITLLFAFMVLWKIYKNEIDLKGFSRSRNRTGKASLSHFQFLVFTFVIAGLFLLLSIKSNTFALFQRSFAGFGKTAVRLPSRSGSSKSACRQTAQYGPTKSRQVLLLQRKRPPRRPT
jgi:hypothetical protein